MSADPLFLSADKEAHRRLRETADLVVAALVQSATGPGPCSSASPEELANLVADLDPCPDEAVALADVLAEIGRNVLAHGVRPWDPRCVAHLHVPTLLTAAATELAIGATNQSMDSYDQAPAATLVEDHLVRWLAGTIGLPEGASGVLTAGGTASNLLALLLARDAAASVAGVAHEGSPTRTGDPGLGGSTPGGSTVEANRAAEPVPGGAVTPHDIAADGLPGEAARWRIVTSAAAHFSVERAAAVLGLGRRAVVAVAADDRGRMDVGALDATLAELHERGLRPIALVGTAGTTDLGAIDPLPALAERAAAAGAWFHVDAAVGSGLCLSERLQPLVEGIERADSVTADLHKLWWQPIGASALLVRDAGTMAVLRHPSDYLDRTEDDGDGHLNLVSRSLDTSRRFDALKILVSLRSTGRRRMAAMVEHLVDTAAEVATVLEDRPDFELLAPSSTVMVLFRWRPAGQLGTETVVKRPFPCQVRDGEPDVDVDVGDDLIDRANVAIQRRLFASGRAVVGRTRHRGRVALKFTLVNPLTTLDDLHRLIDDIAAEGTTWLAEHRQSTPLEAVP